MLEKRDRPWQVGASPANEGLGHTRGCGRDAWVRISKFPNCKTCSRDFLEFFLFDDRGLSRQRYMCHVFPPVVCASLLTSETATRTGLLSVVLVTLS